MAHGSHLGLRLFMEFTGNILEVLRNGHAVTLSFSCKYESQCCQAVRLAEGSLAITPSSGGRETQNSKKQSKAA